MVGLATTDLSRTVNEDREPLLKTSVLDLFDQNAKRSPASIAAEFQGQSVTYDHLYNASIRVALELRKRGFRPRDRIPLITNMSLEMVASVLGILRFGASYCPIDFNAWSTERVIATLEAVGSRMVLSTVETTIPGYELVRMPETSSHIELVTKEEMEELKVIRRDMRQSDLIYIIFTSGTTGKPKGVMVPHSSAVHLVQQDFAGAMRGSPGEKVLLFFSVAFDGCAGVIFSTICHGGTLAMAQPSDVINTASSCSTLILTPSMLASLEPTPEFDCVHSIYMGGEAPSEALVELWTSLTRKVYNCYGPTECTTAVSTVAMVPGGPIVLGNLISEVEIVLLDENLEHEVRQGEICIRGPCLAVGYLNMEALTQKKFFFRDGIRHYRTGDLARRDEDGLHFVARVDRIVKNRGFLINLEAEVEPALRSFSGIKKAAAFVLQKQLVAFVTPSEVPVDILREYLAQKFDAFIIPDLIFAINDFKLTPNGKVDTRALQAMVKEQVDDRLRSYSSTETDVFAALDVVLQAFAVIFDRPVSQIPSTASFRSLGGHSLTAVKLQSHLRRENLSLALSKIFELDTAVAIARAAVSADRIVTADVSSSATPLTPHQLQLFEETEADPSSNYVFYCLTRNTADSPVNAKTLRKAWEVIFTRHAIYRTRFDMDTKVQKIHTAADVDWREFSVLDYKSMEAVSRSKREALWTTLRSQRSPISILKPHFWIVEVPGEAIQMNWLVHHSYTDAWSFGILLEELELIINGNVATLPPTSSYDMVAQHLNGEAKRQATTIKKFWSAYSRPWTQLRPVQLLEPGEPNDQPWNRWESDIPLQVHSLSISALQHGVSAATIIYTAWALVLADHTRSNTVGMKISVSGRNIDHSAAERAVGSLNGRCPLIFQTKEDTTISETLRSLQRTLLRVNDYQWTYPELRSHIERAFGNKAYWFDSQILVLLDMPVDTTNWRIFEEQKPTAPMELNFIQRGDTFNMRVRYDCTRYAQNRIDGMGKTFIEKLIQLVASPLDTKIGDLGHITQN